MDWIYTLSGFAVGFIVGLTGVGGGSLMTPLLVLVFGIAPGTAVGTDLLYASITKAGGSIVHAWRHTVNWRIAGLLALGSVPAALLSLMTLKSLAAKGTHFNGVITTTLGVALILTALALLLKDRLQKFALRNKEVRPTLFSKKIAVLTIVAGAVLGVLVTISSVGAGALGVVALFFLYPQLPAKNIVGTDIVHAVPLTAIAGLGHAYLGTVDLHLLGSLLLGSLPGIYLGSQVGTSIPEKVLRPILATMLLFIGGRLVI